MKRLHPSVLRAAWWAWKAARAARRQLRESGGLGEVRIPPPPDLPEAAGRGVDAMLARRRDRCLTRAHVRQVWLAAHGEPRDLVIGVRTHPEFSAHAWLDGDDTELAVQHVELVRRPAS